MTGVSDDGSLGTRDACFDRTGVSVDVGDVLRADEDQRGNANAR